jgi:hypothetical protein
MGESRPDDPAADPGVSELSPPQKAWIAYQRHTGSCDLCRERGSGRCATAGELLKIHGDRCDEAYAALAAERRARF